MPGRSWRRDLVLPAASVAIALLLPLATFLTVSWLAGWRLQVVLSGSMAPAMPVGSVAVVKPVDPSQVREGMALAFVDPADPARLVTHRVVEVSDARGSAYFRTKGDANATVDALPVPAHAVRGKVGWVVPHLGAVLQWLQWPRGFLTLVVLPATVLVVTEARAARRPREVPVAATVDAAAES